MKPHSNQIGKYCYYPILWISKWAHREAAWFPQCHRIGSRAGQPGSRVSALNQHTASGMRWSVNVGRNLFCCVRLYCRWWKLFDWAAVEYLDCGLAFQKILPKFSSYITQPLSLGMHELWNKSGTTTTKKGRVRCVWCLPTFIVFRASENTWLADSLERLFIFALHLRFCETDFQDCIWCYNKMTSLKFVICIF